MTQNKKIAVTGGIGSGKSAVLASIGAHGYPVFSCDEIYRELCSEKEFLQALGERFPGCVKGGKLDRTALADLIFHDRSEREKLNSFTHPRIMERLFARMEEHPLSFAEVPLLFESGNADRFDAVIAVMRDRDARLGAAIGRGLSESEALARMASQRDWELPPPNVLILENNGTLETLNKKVDELLKRL